MNLRYMNVGDMQKTKNTHFASFGLSQYADMSIPVIAAGRMKFPWVLIGRYSSTSIHTMINTDKMGEGILLENIIPVQLRELVYVGTDVLAFAFAFKKLTLFKELNEPHKVSDVMMNALSSLIPMETKRENNDLMVHHDNKWKKITGLSPRHFCFSLPVNISVDYDYMNNVINRDWLLKTRNKDIVDYRDAAIGLDEIIPDLDVWLFAENYAKQLSTSFGFDLVSIDIKENELSKLFEFMETNTLPKPTLESSFQIYLQKELDT